jgi:hypothetical protein
VLRPTVTSNSVESAEDEDDQPARDARPEPDRDRNLS